MEYISTTESIEQKRQSVKNQTLLDDIVYIMYDNQYPQTIY